MTTQVRNDEQINLLRGDFQPRYEPNFAWKSAVSALMVLPGVRAAWPMSVVAHTAPEVTDVSGNGNHLTMNAVGGSPQFSYDQLAPYCRFVAANSQYLSKADGGAGNWADVTGTETYIRTAAQGLTLGGWFYFSSRSGGERLMAKEGVTTAYRMNLTGANGIRFSVNAGGGAVDFSTAGGEIAANNTWYHIVGWFDPSTEMGISINGAFQTLVAGVPASIQDTADAFTIAATATPGNYFDGFASLCFLAAAHHEEYIIQALFQQQRALFGV